MARPLRIEYPGAFYHVFNRGIARSPIFLDQKDYLGFLERLEKLFVQFRFLVHSYCLMPNHYHLLLRQRSEGGISLFAQKLGLDLTHVPYQGSAAALQAVLSG